MNRFLLDTFSAPTEGRTLRLPPSATVQLGERGAYPYAAAAREQNADLKSRGKHICQRAQPSRGYHGAPTADVERILQGLRELRELVAHEGEPSGFSARRERRNDIRDHAGDD